MPRIPEDTKTDRAQSLTLDNADSAHGKDEDVIQFELARIAKDQKDRLASFQLDDRLEGITHELSSEVDKIYGETLPSAGDGLTRKAVDAIDKRLDAESGDYNREEKEQFRQAFEPFRPKLLQKAAELESEARETYYLGRLRDEADRLSAKVLETGALAPDEFDGLKAKIEKADLTEHQKKDFSKQVQKEMSLAETKARLIKDETFRESFLNGNDKLKLEKDTRGELVRFAKAHHLQTLNDEARASYHDYKELDGMIARDEIGYRQAKPRISHLPQHLQDRLRAREQQRDEAFNLARSFQVNPKDKQSGEALLQHLTSGKDILADDETRAFVAGFSARHQIIPANIANTLRQAAETRDPARLIRAVELAEDFESVKQDVFKENRFSDLRGKVKLIQLLRERYVDEKTREEALLNILQPEKPLGMEELERLHGTWIEKQAGLFASSEEARTEFADQLRSGLEITNGERELALQIAEVMHSKEGKSEDKSSIHDQKVNRAEKEDLLKNFAPSNGDRLQLDALKESFGAEKKLWAPKRDAFYKRDKKGSVIYDQSRPIAHISNNHKEHIISLAKKYNQFLHDRGPLGKRLTNDRDLMIIRGSESSHNPWALNVTSNARGLGQAVENTWYDLIRIFRPKLLIHVASKIGISDVDGLLDNNVSPKDNEKLKTLKRHLHLLAFDKDWNNALIAELAEENARALKKVGIEINVKTLHILHFLGQGRGKKILLAKPSNNFDTVLGDKTSKLLRNQNRNLFKGIETVGQFIARMNKKVHR